MFREQLPASERSVEVGGGIGRLVVDGQAVSLGSGHALSLGSNTGRSPRRG